MEAGRIKRCYTDLELEKEVLEKRKKVYDFQIEFYAKYDDDEEERAGKDGYYRDRERWWESRKRDRLREREWDGRDAKHEEEEKNMTREQSEKRQAAEKEALDLQGINQDINLRFS
jgi:hypothetical protein